MDGRREGGRNAWKKWVGDKGYLPFQFLASFLLQKKRNCVLAGIESSRSPSWASPVGGSCRQQLTCRRGR